MGYKKEARQIAQSAINAVMPHTLISNSLHYENQILTIFSDKYDLSSYDNIYVYGSGKASIEMAKSIKDLLGDRVKEYFVVANYSQDIEGICVLESTHPLPSEKSVQAGEAMLSRFSSMDSNDFYIYLLSGGSSALIEKPIPPITIEEFSTTTNFLLKNSVPIEEINSVRKSLSLVKGGGLTQNTKAKGAVLVISDVIGNDLETIGSAPLLYKEKSVEAAQKILAKYKLLELLPKSVQNVLEGNEESTEKEIHSPKHYIVGSNEVALDVAAMKAKEFGFQSIIVTNSLEGNVKDVAKEIADMIKKVEADIPTCLLFGGESTVEVIGDGRGGRNTELCLWMLYQIKDEKGITFTSVGTDGIDGNSDAAGGVIESGDFRDDINLYLINNDSYSFLERDENLIITGESGTNVMDIMVAIKGG